ncbi:MAG: DUF6134 family protein [Cyclobacteriaceae bacterium]
MKTNLLILFIALTITTSAQKVEANFEVQFKGKGIGTLHAVDEKKEGSSLKDLRTQTDVKIIAMSIHVESEVESHYKDGVFVRGTSYREANRGAEDIHAHVNKVGERKYERVRNGEKSVIEELITTCVVDLFFAEPKGIEKVFSNMYAEFLKIEELSPGKYKLITPDNKDSYYTYRAGQLVMVETDTPLGTVVSRRI